MRLLPTAHENAETEKRLEESKELKRLKAQRDRLITAIETVLRRPNVSADHTKLILQTAWIDNTLRAVMEGKP